MIAKVLGFISLVSTAFMSMAAAAQQDMPTPSFPKEWQLGLQTPASTVAEMIHKFHNELLWMCIIISAFVLILLLICIFRFNEKANPVPSKTSHNTMIEIIWTVVPIIVLVILAIPSYRLLFYMDRTTEAEMTIKVIGNQWFWSYEYEVGDKAVSFDAIAIPEDQIDKAKGQHRLLETDRHVVLPVETNIRILFTANDVIHAWTIPAFGVKLDNMPGRTNESWVRITKEGRFYGQCSELCGIDHSFMPIVVDVVSKEKFAEWVAKEAQAAEGPATSQLASAQ